MLDRESTFAHPEIVKLLRTEFVPIAIDQAYQRRQKDTEGNYYRKIAAQGPRDLNGTTQGFYVASASGKLLLYNNNRDPEKVLRLMKQSAMEFRRLPSSDRHATGLRDQQVDRRYSPAPPKGGLVIRVRARILDGYEPTDNKWRRIFQTATSRDNLWLTAEEHKSLAAGTVPDLVARRLARYHLVDNTRGEPPMWKDSEIKSIDLKISDGTINGNVHLRTASGDREYKADLHGWIESKGGRVTRLDLVARGNFRGEGPYTRGAPRGWFPLAVTFRLADGKDTADAIPPQGSRGWIQGYLR